MGQTVLSRMFSKYMWLQLWFSNMPFYHKMWEHHTHQDKNVGAIEYDIIVNYTDVINVVLWCSVPVGTPIREH